MGKRPKGPLVEQYRPKTFGEVVGQAKALGIIRQIAKRGLGGRAYWISGLSGTGKTTLAWLIARELADDMMIEENDAHEIQPTDLRRIERTMRLRGLGKKHGRAYILNEAHGLQQHMIRMLMTTLERLPSHVVWAFTTTNVGNHHFAESKMDAAPLLSRCIEIKLEAENLSRSFARLARKIARAEGLDGGGALSDYVALVKDCDNNMRAALQAIESGAMLEPSTKFPRRPLDFS